MEVQKLVKILWFENAKSKVCIAHNRLDTYDLISIKFVNEVALFDLHGIIVQVQDHSCIVLLYSQ